MRCVASLTRSRELCPWQLNWVDRMSAATKVRVSALLGPKEKIRDNVLKVFSVV